jgi:hypothetical protein
MNLFGFKIVEHPALAENVAWVIFKRDAPQVPADIRQTIQVPCILTSNVALTERTLTFLQAVSQGMGQTSGTRVNMAQIG